MVKLTHGIKDTTKIFDYRKILAITALLFVMCGCSSVSGKIGNTSITDQEAEQLYNAFEKLEKHEIGEIPLIGGGDINVSITVGNESILIEGSSPFGLIITDKVYIADPFNSFFDINTELREKYDLTVSLMGIGVDQIYKYDANEIVSQWIKDWQYNEDICFDIYYVGKNASLETLGKILGV